MGLHRRNQLYHMKQLIIVANWKADNIDIRTWCQKLAKNLDVGQEKKIIICPPFHHLFLLQKIIFELNLPLFVGSQDVSAFAIGAYTGEEPAELLKELITYTILGHSERRKYLREDDELLRAKAGLALKNGITPIFCVQDETTFVPQGVTIIAYEPEGAIGTGRPDTPENASRVAKLLKEKYPNVAVLYGGSVVVENVASFTKASSIDGVLVGGASLDPVTFTKIIKQA